MEPVTINPIQMPTTGQFQLSQAISEYSKRLRAFIRKRVKRLDEAEDILQDVFLKLAETDRFMKPIDELGSWLFTVARNRITDSYRKKRTDPLPEISDNDEEFLDEIGHLLFDEQSTPENEYVREVFWAELHDALAQLPDNQREVFELTELEGFSFKELAEQMQLPVNTLLSRKRYAVLHLRKWFRDFYTEFLEP